jgi:XTP/dITP diphosphohydrolase
MPKTYRIVLGTNNRHKVAEIREKIARSEALRALDARVEIVPLSEFPAAPEIVEDRDTFEGNAVKKATTLARTLGLPVVADDSGLRVDALDGRPGVMSARYAGVHGDYEANNRKVLREMANVPAQKRTARFVTVVAFAKPDGLVFIAEGKVEGLIATEPRGANGFGYDPIFLLPERGVTMAQLTLAEKNAVSHRARAIEAFCEKLASYLQAQKV